MGSFGSMLTAVAGLRAQSFAMQNISGNIANSSTPGFKRVDTGFADLVPEQPLNRQISGSVGSFSRATNTLSGEFLPTNLDPNVAINGAGFLTVGQRPMQTSTVVRQSPELYTRRGDFELDRQGYLVNGAGYALRGTMLDRTTGLPLATQSDGFIQISQELLGRLDPAPTGNVTYNVTLPQTPRVTNYNATVPNSELLDDTLGGPVLNAAGNVDAGDPQTTNFLRSTLGAAAGPSTTPLGPLRA
jgi:flagellar hook protein FlgE